MPAGYQLGKFLAPEKHDILSTESDIIVAGYGRIDDGTETPNDQLRKGHVKIAGLLNEKEIGFNQEDRNGVCSGDSGGPAFIEVDGEMYAFGIASRVSGPDEKTYCSKWSFHGLIGTQQEFIDSAMAQFSR
ncbi:Trypsin [compost metagenome]